MPQLQDPAAELAEKFTSLTPERQSALLQKMSPEQKTNLHSALQAHVARQSAPPAANQSATPSETPGAFKRAASAYFQNLLPSTNAGDYLYPFAHPIDAISNLPLVADAALKAQGAELPKSIESFKRGDIGGGLSHGLGYVLPVVGPALANAGEQIRSGDVAGGLGATAAIATGLFAPEAFKRIPTPEIVTPGFLRRRVQTMIGAQPEGVTKPLVEAQVADIAKHHEAMGEHATRTGELLAEHGTKQVAADAATEAANRGITEEAFRKAGETKAAFDKRVADQKAAQAVKVQGVEAANAEARRVADLRKTGEESLKAGHQVVGESIADVAQKLRQEGNEKYATVREATANDPGVPLADLGREAKVAQSMIKGSPENIKQFRELIRQSPEAQSVETSMGKLGPGDPIYEALVKEGAIDLGGNLPFDQLQGYSSEIGTRLAAGNLPGDVYQALKYLKDKIDTAKATIADRSGAGPQLRDAESFWHSYMDTFYDKDSAVAKVRKNVGVKDPQFYAEPFTTGKSAQVGANKLRGVNPDGTPNALANSRHAAELNEIADAAMQLRDTHAQVKGLPNLKESPLPIAPKPIAKPAPVEVEYKGRTEVPAPKLPTEPTAPAPLTPTDIAAARREKAFSKSVSIGQASKWDFATAGVSTGLKQAMSGIFASDRFVDFVSKPTVKDLKFIEALPESDRARLRTALKQEIGRSSQAGKPVAVSPSLAKTLGIVAATIPKTAGEARDRLRAIQ